MITQMYQVKRPALSAFVTVRNLSYHVHTWGTPSAEKTPLVLLHGWMDVGGSYQFVVDALRQDHYIIAPDWRGYGKTGSGQADNFWFPDYLADLEWLLDHFAGDQAVHLVGHSMGGNIAMMYAGIRPERIRRLVNLEGFGMPATQPDQAATRYAKWMDELKKLHRGELNLKAYDNSAGVARRLMKTNPRISADKAEWLSCQWAAEDAQGKWNILGEPAHKLSNANLFRVEEQLALYKRLSMPVLCVEAQENQLTQWWGGSFTLAEYHERLKSVPHCEIATVADAGHMMHHDQPEVVADLIEQFITS